MGNSCYIFAVMGRPKDASGCHCVLSLCNLMYCHLPNISPWRLRKFTNPNPTYSKYHLLVLSCHSSVHMTHVKVIKQHVTEFVLSLTLHQIIPALHPLSSPPAVSGAPGLCWSQHPRRHPRQGAAPRRQFGRCQPPCAAVSNLRRRRARRRQRLAPPRGSPPPTPTLDWERLESAE